MHALDMLEVGHQMVLDSVRDLPKREIEAGGACGIWSIKDIIAHLTAYEALVADILTSLTHPGNHTPVLERFLSDPAAFNDAEVENRQGRSLEDILDEYTAMHCYVIDEIIRIPEATLREPGALPWYGDAYDVEDFLVYTSYAHKREHCAQIEAFKDNWQK